MQNGSTVESITRSSRPGPSIVRHVAVGSLAYVMSLECRRQWVYNTATSEPKLRISLMMFLGQTPLQRPRSQQPLAEVEVHNIEA